MYNCEALIKTPRLQYYLSGVLDLAMYYCIDSFISNVGVDLDSTLQLKLYSKKKIDAVRI